MKIWQEDLLSNVEGTHSKEDVFCKVAQAVRELGFTHCSYGLRLPLPLSNPKIIVMSNYPAQWQERYSSAGYLARDPTVIHGCRSNVPLIWNDDVFKSAKDLWAEAQSFDLRVGWAQSSLHGGGMGGMLTLARSAEPLTVQELKHNEIKMRWLVHVAHLALARIVMPSSHHIDQRPLTVREIDVLRWTADGKTSSEIAEILTISVDTVNFHVKNAVIKLKTANKTAAVVRAAMLGWLH